jgi:hypothetical protein
MGTLPMDPDLARELDDPRDPETGEPLDCTRCGACCHAGEGNILISPEDLVRWKATGRDDLVERTDDGHFGMRSFAVNEHGACVHLGWPEGRSLCSIYEERASTCREFQAGSWQCLEFRRDFASKNQR